MPDIPSTLQRLPGQAQARVNARIDADRKPPETMRNLKGNDGQFASAELQNLLQKQQQTVQTISDTSKLLHDSAMAII